MQHKLTQTHSADKKSEKGKKLDDIKGAIGEGLGDTLKEPIMSKINETDGLKDLPDKIKEKAADKAVEKAIDASVEEALKKWSESLTAKAAGGDAAAAPAPAPAAAE
eukprot:TRINITY_DN2625_c0_g1_i1.p1 TRINITY_DN2625_c0_g1~~TRINITY_DN2625_c0_g1_i1.p1  ORF type:complete len:107 (-),score=45.59 TRINITY_DN2625_c0_g1_i1:127-447(-)